MPTSVLGQLDSLVRRLSVKSAIISLLSLGCPRACPSRWRLCPKHPTWK